MNGFLLPIYTLAWRELIRFFRQRNRVVGALLQPVIFFVLFGQAFSGSFRPPVAYSGGYQEYFFPGTIVMILLFTAIFATISIIEDRREGFLQSVLVAPVPRLAMVLGKILGGTLLAVFQALLFFSAIFFLDMKITPLAAIEAIGLMFVIGIAMTALGFTIAWRMESTQGFHAIMSVFLLPMWLLSGAIFPADGAPVWLAWMIKLNPLSYGLAALRQVLYPGIELPGLPPLGLSLAITFAFAVITVLAAAAISKTRTTGDLH
jgi:ABC-2 type transport system permease protein